MVTQDVRWEFKVGMPVEATNGPVGHLQQVVLNPGDGRVTALVIRRGGLPPHDFVVPLDAVAYANDTVVRLNLSKEAVEAQPPLQRGLYLAPGAGAPGYSPRQVLFSLRGGPRGGEQAGEGRVPSGRGSPVGIIRAGQRVEATDGAVGTVDRVLVDGATKRATHFTVRKGLLLSKDILVPVEWIAEYQPDAVKLAVDRAALEHLPTYRPDQEIQWDVENAIEEDPLLAESLVSAYPISILVRDGVVMLLGNVRNATEKQHAQDVAASVRGALGVDNRLVADDELEQAIAQALNRDPRTRDLSITPHAWYGIVHLEGDVPTSEARAAAEEITARVPGVRTVVNMLSVAGVSTPWEQERLRELSTGQPVYAQGTPIGQVEKLLIDPQTWRVTALVVRLIRSAAANGQAGPLAGGPAVVVPVAQVERVTVGAVYLSLPEEAIPRLPRFDPARYPVPDGDWRLPVPYRRSDIALDLSQDRATARQPGSASSVQSSMKTIHGL